MSVLHKINAMRRAAVAEDARRVPIVELRVSPYYTMPVRSLARAVQANHGLAIVAEHKRASPTEGDYACPASLAQVVEGYASAGAVGISILTEPTRFGGSLDHLREARVSTTLPLLRKDFIVDDYQIEEAKSAGADAVLLIAAGLTLPEARGFCRKAHDLGMEVLLELHNATELDYLSIEPDLVGVNNRDLRTLAIDLETSLELVAQLPTDLARLSESGVNSVADARNLLGAGYDGLLIGTQFMKTANPGTALLDFVMQLTSTAL